MSETEIVEQEPTPQNLSGLTKFSAGPKNLEELVTLAHSTVEKSNILNRKVAGFQNTVDTEGLKIDENIARLQELDANTRQTLIAKEKSRVRRDVVAGSDETRYDLLRSVLHAETTVDRISAMYQSPAHILARTGLGSEQRSRFQDQMSNSGPMEVANFAALAVAEKNPILGAVVLSKLDGMSKSDRQLSGISRQELSKILAGETYEKAQEAIRLVKGAAKDSLNTNRQFELGRSDPNATIARGLRQRQMSGALEDE